MELRHIRYFLTLAEEGTFTKAAEKLMIAQPPLSRQIKDLEEEIGTELFKRSPRGVVLTEAGEKFREYAQQIEYLSDQSIEVVRDLKTGLHGTLNLASVDGQAPHLISGWLAGFHELYPKVEFTMWSGNSDDVLKRLRGGLSDLGLIVGPYDQENLDGMFVYEEPWIAMIPASNPLAKLPGDEIELSELAPYDLIIPSRISRLREISGWFAVKNQKPKVICRMSHIISAFELTEQNVGIAIYPAAAGIYADREKVVIKKITEPRVTASYYLAKSNTRELTAAAKAFWEFVSAQDRS